MKKGLIVGFILLCNGAVYAQSQEVQQLLLNIEKLAQLKSMLSNMKKGFTTLSNGYGAIEDGAKEGYQMHDDYLDGLLGVNPLITRHKKTVECFVLSKAIVGGIGSMRKNLSSGSALSGEEKEYLLQVHATVLKATTRDVGELSSLLTGGTYRMTDGERLQAVDRLHARLQDRLKFIRHYSNSQTFLTSQRHKERSSIDRIKKLYSLKP